MAYTGHNWSLRENKPGIQTGKEQKQREEESSHWLVLHAILGLILIPYMTTRSEVAP